MQDEDRKRPTGTSGSQAGGRGEEPTTEKQGQHWRGEPWEKNPKVGGKEQGTEPGEGTSGQHWRGDDLPVERKKTDQDR